MCTSAKDCNVCKELETKYKSSIAKYWSVISGLLALIVTIVVFYANTIHATDMVTEHEQRIRALEKLAAEDTTLLKEIKTHMTRIDDKIDKVLYK